MPGTLFFVHGTGVRKSDYEATLDDIREGCAREPRFANVVIADNCPWGEDLGTNGKLVELTLPPQDRTRALAPALTADQLELALWSILLEDPLFELRIASQQPPEPGLSIGRQPPDVAAEAVLARIMASPPAAAGVPGARISAGAKSLGAAPELSAAALAAGTADDPELVQIVARSVVAFALKPVPGEVSRPAAALDGALRDAAVDAVRTAFAPTTRGLRSWVKDKVTDTIKGIATDRLVDRRAGLTGGALPTIGDIFFHLRRGSIFIDYVAEKLAAWPEPIVAVGHSLGGVILVDLLSRGTHPPVAKLVTAGSQAPLFFSMDSLETLRPGNTPSPPFVPWLNIYDRSDFLSYLAGEVFGENAAIKDEEVRSGVPFPDSHSAYWKQARTYQLISNFWP
ncbi:MAG: hypothetical protein ABIP13_03290 [Tepidiformaceae bacterium]